MESVYTNFIILLLLNTSNLSLQQNVKPTLYQYFTEGGINLGLQAPNADGFTLNGKDFKLVSGTLMYFRVHPDQWRDRLRKMRAAGLNTVDV